MSDEPGAYVYVLDTDHGTKVGITIQSVEERISDLRRGSGIIDVRLVASFGVKTRSHAYQVEQAAHWLLRDSHTVGEWFHCHPLEAARTIERILHRGIPLEFVRHAVFGRSRKAA